MIERRSSEDLTEIPISSFKNSQQNLEQKIDGFIHMIQFTISKNIWNEALSK